MVVDAVTCLSVEEFNNVEHWNSEETFEDWNLERTWEDFGVELSELKKSKFIDEVS